MKSENANIAGKNLLQINIQKPEPVQDHAEIKSVGIKSIRKVGKADVYNMEVADNHNFAISGGLIVHNCMDAMRYFVKTKHITRIRNDYQPIYMNNNVGYNYGRR